MSLRSSLAKKAPTAVNAYHFLWAWAGARLHKRPSRRLFVIGVTGTKGKTTTLELLNAILEAAGKRTALLSSLRVKIGGDSRKNPTGNSMPGRGYLQKFLKQARRERCGYAIIEVTSQGVVQHRHRFIDWNLGVLTNLHPEHIEAHGSFENYRAAKLAFLKYVLKKGGKVFLNRDDANFDFFSRELAQAGDRAIGFSRADTQVKEHLSRVGRAHDREGDPARAEFLMSDFNAENAAVAISIAKELGIPDHTIEEALIVFKGVPGRMEFVSEGPYTAIVDYAHTPDSLEAAYRAARAELVEGIGGTPGGRLVCVLGAAGGGRDAWKRPEFGKIAAHYCDEVILTNEDPYDEDPQAIIDAVAAGVAQMPYPRPDVVKVLDRGEALAKAVDGMDEGDIVIATGKGSEDWIHAAHGKKIPWNERATVQELLARKRTKSPAPDVLARG
ncbi:MAG TPA: UDP-N-acetylmuramyl-tripeptide synthetase [Candidatus Paceibacterota bacterium]|nr:UDP-N-acetylmuramyl-tripeptide synthetase [Candidatus Paceibacterota bacterium]